MKSIFASRKGIIKIKVASFELPSSSEDAVYLHYGTYSREKSRYGPSIIVMARMPSSISWEDYDKTFQLINIYSEGTYNVYVTNQEFDLPLFTPVRIRLVGDPTAYTLLFIGDNKFLGNAPFAIGSTYEVISRTVANVYSSVAIAHSYWERGATAPVSEYYPAVAQYYPSFAASLHVLASRKMFTPPGDSFWRGLEFYLEYKLAKDNTETNEIKLYINPSSEIAWTEDFTTYSWLFTRLEESSYQLTSGIFKDDSFYEDNGPDVFYWYPENVLEEALQVPYDIAVGVKNDEETTVRGALLLRHNNVDYSSSDAYAQTMKVVTKSGSSINVLSPGFPVISSSSIDLRVTLHTDEEVNNLSFVTVDKVSRERALKAVLPVDSEPIMSVDKFDLLSNPRPQLSYIPVVIDGSFKAISVYRDIIASLPAQVVRLNYANYGGIFVALVGKTSDGRLVPVPFRTSILEPGKVIEIPYDSVDAFVDIYAIIDENTPKAEATFYAGDTYPFQKVIIFPRETLALVTNNSEVWNRINTESPDLLTYHSMARALDAQFLAFKLSPFGYSEVITDYEYYPDMPVVKLLLI